MVRVNKIHWLCMCQQLKDVQLLHTTIEQTKRKWTYKHIFEQYVVRIIGLPGVYIVPGNKNKGNVWIALPYNLVN